MINKKLEWDKNKKNGFPHAIVDNFLDKDTCLKLYEECLTAPRGGWTSFTRAGSSMEEFNDLIHCPTAHKITYDLMHSGEFLYDLEQMSGISGLLPDPHLVGAGFSIFRNGSYLGCHYDFNWNDRLRLHRKLTSILFLTPDWENEWGGHHQAWTGNYETDKNAKLITEIAPKFNRFLITENEKHKPYHSVKKINCPENIQGRCAIRFFYYISTSDYDKDNPPHKSTYSSMEYTHKKLYKDKL